VPFQQWQQQKCYVGGGEEADDLGDVGQELPSQGPKRQRPFVAVQKNLELDPHNHKDRDVSGELVHKQVAFRQPITGACPSLCPQWRRKPMYRTRADGMCSVVNFQVYLFALFSRSCFVVMVSACALGVFWFLIRCRVLEFICLEGFLVHAFRFGMSMDWWCFCFWNRNFGFV
jgi:hypothetical protein